MESPNLSKLFKQLCEFNLTQPTDFTDEQQETGALDIIVEYVDHHYPDNDADDKQYFTEVALTLYRCIDELILAENILDTPPWD